MKPKYIYIFFLITILSLLTIQTKILKITSSDQKSEPIEQTLTVSLMVDEKPRLLDLEEYLIGVLACEMPALFEEEALKAGAIAARTYALEKLQNARDYIFTGTTADQCYSTTEELKEKWQENYNEYIEKIQKQIEATKGIYLSYESKPIKAFYFSVSNGYTENVKEVFGEELDYLISVESPLDKNTKGYEKEVTLSKETFLKYLNLNEEETITIKNIEYTESRRVKNITINNQTFTGIEVRNLLNLRSTDFTIKENENNIIITTKGYGHGVGMSQYGANELAKQGYTYEEILKHYYKNVDFSKV